LNLFARIVIIWLLFEYQLLNCPPNFPEFWWQPAESNQEIKSSHRNNHFSMCTFSNGYLQIVVNLILFSWWQCSQWITSSW
jgi:hypothetical protein